MKIHLSHFFLFVMTCIVLTGCAPTMYVQTGSNSEAVLNKNAPHYIVPPAATDSQQTKDLYPLVVNAFQANHIALTTHKNEATYLVTWGTESQSSQRRIVVATYGTSDWNANLNVNSYNYYGGPNGIAATGPQYATVMQSYRMQNFTINIWKNEQAKTGQSNPVWSGSATTEPKDAKNPAKIIHDIVARYGTSFAGTTEIKNQ